MGKIKILHAADFHLDSPFSSLDREQAAVRRGEQREILNKIVELAAEERVDIVLLAGDLLDSQSAYSETYDIISAAMKSIDAQVFISPGNHDFYSLRSHYSRLEAPENVHIFKTGEIECVELPELSARVFGAAFTGTESGPLLRGLNAAGDAVNIGVMHGEQGPQSRYNPISEQEIADSGLDYLALGHVHSFSGERKAGGTVFAWPGCTEGRGFDETGEKGVIIAETDKTGASVRFVPLGSRRYEYIAVDITDAESAADAVIEAVGRDSQRDIYRVTLTGEAPPPSLSELKAALESRFFSLHLRDRTRPRRDIWESVTEDSLRGIFVRKLRVRYDAAKTPEERELIMGAVRWGMRALDNGEELSVL